MLKSSLVALSLAVGLSLGAVAEMVHVDLVDVPVERLLANYRTRLKGNPNDSQVRYVTGRLEALAYAQAGLNLKTDKRDGSLYSGLPGAPVLSGLATARPKRTPAGDAHLKAAIAEFDAALKLNPRLTAAVMCRAWCLEQLGQTRAALDGYRQVFKLAYAEAMDRNHALFGVSLAEEAGHALERLLDPKQDAAELAEVRTRVKQCEQRPRAVTPILIPLQESHRFEDLLDPDSPVRFDLDGSGRNLAWGWIRPQAAWLVYLQERVRVESALQMFGTSSFYTFWDDGYQALAALDGDLDGRLRGAELDGLCLWQDVNSDGQCQPEEVAPLADWGIVGLSCRWRRHARGFPYSPAGVEYQDGRKGPSYDWIPSWKGR